MRDTQRFTLKAKALDAHLSRVVAAQAARQVQVQPPCVIGLAACSLVATTTTTTTTVATTLRIDAVWVYSVGGVGALEVRRPHGNIAIQASSG